MKYLVAGLGNPGDEYADTRHNAGFLIADALAQSCGGGFSPGRLAFHAQVKYRGRLLVIIKPVTFMNLSGRAVSYWLQQEKISPENLIVALDDIALPFGTLRLRPKGSDGGHNGLKSINESLGHSNYPRLRFGIGSDFSKGRQSDYVLGTWSSEERKLLPERIEKAVEIIQSAATEGIGNTMTKYNQ